MENQQFLSDIEDLLNDVESTPIEENSGEVDELVNEANSAFDGKKMEVITLQPEAKHQKAVDSQEPFELNLLSQDEKFNIRVLSACNPNISSGSLLRMVEEEDDYVRMVVAHNPNSSADVLSRIVELTGEEQVLSAVFAHKNTSEVVKFKIKNKLV